jgi:Xaa-Pro aminopeptidase
MLPDEERIARIQRVLAEKQWDALVCTFPSNVLMLSGYWPVIGSSIAIARRDGSVALLVPEDERELAEAGWAHNIRTFEGGSLDRLSTVAENVSGSLSAPDRFVVFHPGDVLGVEAGASLNPASYASTFIYGPAIQDILRRVFPGIVCADATPALECLRSTLTSKEIDILRHACTIAQNAFLQAQRDIAIGMREFEIASALRSKLRPENGQERSEGFAYCMSGPNSAKAYAAYQQSRSRAIASGDFVLLHCNSYCGGFWTDITRTFSAGPPDARMASIMEAVLEASYTAINAVRPGITASAVDRAARTVLTNRGFGHEFKHPAGHGVGFATINHNACPRIHPLSDEILLPGMVFNIEPAVYIADYGGMRHCNMVAVSETGSELLTPFLERQEDLRFC